MNVYRLLVEMFPDPVERLEVMDEYTPKEIAAIIFEEYTNIVTRDFGWKMEKTASGELVIHTGWTYDDEQEKYREMTEEELG